MNRQPRSRASRQPATLVHRTADPHRTAIPPANADPSTRIPPSPARCGPSRTPAGPVATRWAGKLVCFTWSALISTGSDAMPRSPEMERGPPRRASDLVLSGSPYGVRTRAAILRGSRQPSIPCCSVVLGLLLSLLTAQDQRRQWVSARCVESSRKSSSRTNRRYGRARRAGSHSRTRRATPRRSCPQRR
jgi:hypothetical protein